MNTAPLVTRLFLYTTVAAMAAAAALPLRAHAASFYLQDQSVKGLGRAYSGEVSDQGAASLWWNPAAIARSGGEIYTGANAILTSAEVGDKGTTITRFGGTPAPVGGTSVTENPVEFGVVPNTAVAIPIGDRFAIGLSAAAPYDFTSTYDPNSFARYDSGKSRLTTLDFQLTGAMKVTEWLDLGAALNAEYTSATLTGALPNLAAGSPDGGEVLKGDGWNYGYTVGTQMHFGKLDVGGSYKSKISHDLDGTITVNGLTGLLSIGNTNSPGKAKFTTPWIATIGARYKLTPRLTLDAQVERFGWSEFDAIRVNFGSTNVATPENYRDTTSGAVGAEYQMNPIWVMRAGVAYDQSPTVTAYRDTRVPDSDRMIYATGTSVKVRPNMTLDASFGYVAFRGSNVDTRIVTPVLSTVNERGYVSGNAKILSLGMRYTF